MASSARRLALALMLGGFAAFCTADGAPAGGPDTETIMKKVNGKKGLTAKIGTAVKSEKWDEAQKMANELKDLGIALGKNDPHKGDKASWEKLTKKYADETAAVADAAGKKDAKATTKALESFTAENNCKGCHKSHK